MLLVIALGIFGGLAVPFQTAVNSRLRIHVKEPFLSSLISFFIGTIFLIILGFIFRQSIFSTIPLFKNLPWWSYLAGVFAMLSLTANIFLFPILGSVQTVVIPMVGQLIISMIIDTFGWLGAKPIPLSVGRILGLVFIIVGIIIYNVLPNIHQGQSAENKSDHLFIWQTIAFLDGISLAVESAMNGHIGLVLHSSINSAFLTFLIATILLAIVNLIRKNYRNLKLISSTHAPWWSVFLGGTIGSTNVFILAYLVPILGAGVAIIVGIFGQIIMSFLIDSFGLLGFKKRPVTVPQIVGILGMIVGIVIVEL